MRAEWLGRWADKTVVCVASGPSLTPQDCDAVRKSGHPTIVTNTTFRICPWAEVLFGMDSKWWREYHKEVFEKFAGRKLTIAHPTTAYGAESLFQQDWFQGFGNSGTCALSLAISGKAKRIVMLGYDAQKTEEKAHWHEDHPQGLTNASSVRMWPKKFDQVARHAKVQGVQIVNCSRVTALNCFERVELESAL